MLFTAVSECAHILLHPSVTLLNMILISPLRSSMRASTLCCCGWPTQRADATQWTLVTETHPSKPCNNTIAHWRWAHYHIFAIIYHLAHHHHHFWLLRFCRSCRRSCSAGRGSRPPSRLCGRSSSLRRRPKTAARPGRSSTWRAANWSCCWDRWSGTSASWNNDWWGFVKEQPAAVLTL